MPSRAPSGKTVRLGAPPKLGDYGAAITSTLEGWCGAAGEMATITCGCEGARVRPCAACRTFCASSGGERFCRMHGIESRVAFYRRPSKESAQSQSVKRCGKPEQSVLCSCGVESFDRHSIAMENVIARLEKFA